MKKNTGYKIWTNDGWKDFDGIRKSESEKLYHFTFEDFQLSKNKILKDIEEKAKKNNDNDTNFEILLLNYISDKIPLLNEDIFLLEFYRIIIIEKEIQLHYINMKYFYIYILGVCLVIWP